MPVNYDQQYTPHLYDPGWKQPDKVYAEVLVELQVCGSCDKPIYYPDNQMWPHFVALNAKAQGDNAGWVPISDPEMKNKEEKVICQPCSEAGKATFTCSLCLGEKPSSQIQLEVGGYSRDCFCKECYENTPARIWSEAVNAAYHDHRYDYD